MTIPEDYEERVYAGVLGKLIGVYLGRPVEGWTHARISRELGEIRGYVHDRVGLPLVVTDDDISGTFTFIRALEDAGCPREIDPAAIGRAWLNYLIENRTVLWWGGFGHSTEHTAYIRLASGIDAPRSGSIELNGRVVAEQIGSQIFIDSWAMVCPGDPEGAASLARSAARVSHDGEAVHAAVLLAAMEAQAFVESDLDRLLDVGLALIPRDSVIARLADDLRSWRVSTPDWRKARDRLEAEYGPECYRGNVHVVPNHGLILLSLLWGDGDFDRTLMIVNTCGWDTDCNSGNVGCLMGIRGGIAGLERGYDWRGPIRDRLYLPTADGGRAITDAVIEADRLAAIGRRRTGQAPQVPKGGARFHFSYPGSVQAFEARSEDGASEPTVANVGDVDPDRSRTLRLTFDHEATGRSRLVTPTFIPPDDIAMPGYRLLASPSVHAGQRVRAAFALDTDDGTAVRVRLTAAHYDGSDTPRWIGGPWTSPVDDGVYESEWTVPETDGQPIVWIGLEVDGAGRGRLDLDRLGWSGTPTVRLGRPADGGTMWRRAWVDGVDQWNTWWDEGFRISQNRGVGLLSQGSSDWTDYRVEADVTPHLATAAGIAARVGGMRRYYAVLLGPDGTARLVRVNDVTTVLAVASLDAGPFASHRLTLMVDGPRIEATVDGTTIASIVDEGPGALIGGGVGIVCEQGTLLCQEVRVTALG